MVDLLIGVRYNNFANSASEQNIIAFSDFFFTERNLSVAESIEQICTRITKKMVIFVFRINAGHFNRMSMSDFNVDVEIFDMRKTTA